MQCLKHELTVYCSCSCIFCRERVREWVSNWVSEWVSKPGSQPLPQSAPVSQILPLHLSQSFTICSCSCCQSLVIPRLMFRYSWWRRSLGTIFMALNFTHSIFDPLSFNGIQWIGDKVIINYSLHFPHFPNILASELLPSSCLSMYGNPNALPQYDQQSGPESVEIGWF